MKGTCKKGEECKFIHEKPDNTGNKTREKLYVQEEREREKKLLLSIIRSKQGEMEMRIAGKTTKEKDHT